MYASAGMHRTSVSASKRISFSVINIMVALTASFLITATPVPSANMTADLMLTST